MKTAFILWSVVLTTLFYTSCQTDDLATPLNGHKSVSSAKGATQSVTTYGGYATGLNATITTTQNGSVTSNQYNFASTGLLPATGGTLNANVSQALVEGALSADSLSANTTGQNKQTLSEASASNINITINGHVITADYVATTASTTCTTATGSTQIVNLVVNGNPITVTGTINQTVVLSPTSFLIINEQSSSKKVKGKNITVSGLHLVGSSDIRVATTQALTKC